MRKTFALSLVLAFSSLPTNAAGKISHDFFDQLQEGHAQLLKSKRNASEAAGLPVDVQNRARNLGHFLRPLIRQVSEQVKASWESMPLPEAKGLAFQKFFGPLLERRDSPDEAVYGDVFRLIKSSPTDVAGNRIEFDNMFSVFGTPALVFFSLDISDAFFYEPTLIDPQTGRVYQAINGTVEIYGPLEPPEEARITGRFDREQARKLELEVDAGLHD